LTHNDFIGCHEFVRVGVYAVRQQPYQILPGDSFSTSFFFQSEEEAIFGPASADEMCNSVLLYYPVKRIFNAAPWACIINITITACDAQLSTTILDLNVSSTTSMSRFGTDGSVLSSDAFQLERTFGYNTGAQCFEKTPASQDNNTSSTDTSATSIRLPIGGVTFWLSIFVHGVLQFICY
jgi:hypothetical protein